MNTDTNHQALMRDFEQVVAACHGLIASDIEGMHDAWLEKWLSLSLADVPEKDIATQMEEFGQSLIKRYQSSVTKASQLVTELKQAPSCAIGAGFPVSDIESLSDKCDPLAKLIDLTDELAKHGDYSRVRDEYCQLSIQLNLQGQLAPAFRPMLVTGRKYGDSVFNAIHRDQLVIDCHWLQVTKQFFKIRDKDVEFARMFKPAASFPFDLAWEFAKKKWTSNHRVNDMLRLTPFQQCQLVTLRGDEMQARIQQVEHGTRKDGRFIPSPLSAFEQGLSAWCERDVRIHKHREGYLAVWKARMFLGVKASVRQVGELAAMMLGEAPKDDKTIRSREVNIGRHILGG